MSLRVRIRDRRNMCVGVPVSTHGWAGREFKAKGTDRAKAKEAKRPRSV